MKRPEKTIMWLHINKEKSEFVNHLEKTLYDYTIKLPTWIGLAYRPIYAKVEIREKVPSWVDRRAETNHDEWQAYFKSNWLKKLTTMRKLNHNYMKVFTLGKSKPKSMSHEDYKNYQQDLAALNKKYLGESGDSKEVR